MVSTCLQIERSEFELQPHHCVAFLGKTLYSHSISLHQGVQMGTVDFNAGDGLGGSRNTPSRFLLLTPG